MMAKSAAQGISLAREPHSQAAYEATTTTTITVSMTAEGHNAEVAPDGPANTATGHWQGNEEPRQALVESRGQLDCDLTTTLNNWLAAQTYDDDDADNEMSLVCYPESRDQSPLPTTQLDAGALPIMDAITVAPLLPKPIPTNIATHIPPAGNEPSLQLPSTPQTPSASSPSSEPLSSQRNGADLLDLQTSPEQCSSPLTKSSGASSPLSELDMDIGGPPIEYDYDGPAGHHLLRLKPTPEQWDDFPALLAFAAQHHAGEDGCFKIVLPEELKEPIPEKAPQEVPANAYRIRQIRQRMFWQVSTVGSTGVFSSSEPEAQLEDSADMAIKNLKTLFNKNKDKVMRHVRYRVDVPAWTAKQRREAGVPEKSPIHPLKGDKLEQTKAIIPGIHTPYVYESGPHFGATFQFHAEDFRLASLNHLYKGRKIWIVIPSTAVDIAEKSLNRKDKCSQFMRHRAEFFFPERLQKMGIPYRIVDQRPGETIVILPDAYHQGFSTGYTLAEAKNYADPDWTTDKYQPCQMKCQLATAIPAEFMRLLREGEERLDLCADYGDGCVALQQPPPPPPPERSAQLLPPLPPVTEEQTKPDNQPKLKRSHDEQEEISPGLQDDRNPKQPRVD